MAEAYVIDAVRSAVGKRGGALSGVHPVDLGALGWRQPLLCICIEVVDRDLDPVGTLGNDVARRACGHGNGHCQGSDTEDSKHGVQVHFWKDKRKKAGVSPRLLYHKRACD